MVFAEGTITSGKHILKLKRGAFSSLLPVKPIMIVNTLSDDFHLSVGSSGLFLHLIRTLCYLYHNIRVIELPIITPNDHLYEYYSKTHPEIKEQWEVFAEVTREIMCEVGNMEKSDMGLRDSIDYSNIVLGVEEKKKKDKNIVENENKSKI